MYQDQKTARKTVRAPQSMDEDDRNRHVEVKKMVTQWTAECLKMRKEMMVQEMIQRLKRCWKVWNRFFKHDIGTNKVSVQRRTVTTIPFLRAGVTKKYTFGSSRVKFVKPKTQIVNIGNTSKNLRSQEK
ncbi:unnamed protein product [Ilex paraguariensis]|uniref:Uncharacterized protein n=1 Tax=Ilex paraguariensis TaxID=185542 RepID=A0ABC8QTK9_9AQUA